MPPTQQIRHFILITDRLVDVFYIESSGDDEGPHTKGVCNFNGFALLSIHPDKL